MNGVTFPVDEIALSIQATWSILLVLKPQASLDSCNFVTFCAKMLYELVKYGGWSKGEKCMREEK